MEKNENNLNSVKCSMKSEKLEIWGNETDHEYIRQIKKVVNKEVVIVFSILLKILF